MALHSVSAGFVLLLVLSAAHPTEQQLSGFGNPSVDEQLSALHGPVEDRGAPPQRKFGWWLAQLAARLAQLAARLEQLRPGLDAGQKALSQLTRQQVLLDTVTKDVTALKLSLQTCGDCERRQSRQEKNTDGQPLAKPARKRPAKGPSPPPPAPPAPGKALLERHPERRQELALEDDTHERGVDCDPRPEPVPADAAVDQTPAVRACGRSCLQLREQNVTQDGVYWLTGLPVPVMCDFNHDDGGWTLLLTAVSRIGWDPYSVLGYNELSPSLTDNYSILKYADTLRDLGVSDRFAYRIESQAEKARRRWGGIWFAPRRYSFIDETSNQTDVSLMRRFDKWVYSKHGIHRRMPWINTAGYHSAKPILTTCELGGKFWGTLVTDHSHPAHRHSAWLYPQATESGTILYWMREEAY